MSKSDTGRQRRTLDALVDWCAEDMPPEAVREELERAGIKPGLGRRLLERLKTETEEQR